MSAPTTNPLPHAPFLLVGAVFGLALFCLAITLTLLPQNTHNSDQTQNAYGFTRTAVILNKDNPRAPHRRPLVVTPGNNAPSFEPEENLPPLPQNPENNIQTTPRDTPFVATPPHATTRDSTPQNTTKNAPTTPNAPRWITNAHPVQVPAHHSKIAIVIDDMGVAADNSQAVIDALPAAVTLAFLPYGEVTSAQSQAAFTKGHDIMVHLPMQPHRATANPGPNALFADDTTAQLNRKINLNLQSLKHISVGVNNHMGSKFTESLSGMRTVLEAAEKEQLFFLDSVTTRNSSTTTARTGLSLPILKRHVFLDHEVTPEFINSALAKTERYAQKHGTAIAIGHPYPQTTAAIAAWAQTLADKNISLVPISHLLQTN